MPTGQPKLGFRRTKNRKGKSLQEIEQEIAFRVPEIIKELEKLTKPITCPHCGNSISVIDKEVGMYLVDRVMGKPTQKHELDITESIQLSGDQIDLLIERYKIATMPLLEGEDKEL